MRIAISLKDASITMKVVEHIIIKNFWEYYILDDSEHTQNWNIKDDIQFAYVLGFENEYGSVSRDEMRPYIISQTRELDEIMPPEGYNWAEEEEDNLNFIALNDDDDDVVLAKLKYHNDDHILQSEIEDDDGMCIVISTKSEIEDDDDGIPCASEIHYVGAEEDDDDSIDDDVWVAKNADYIDSVIVKVSPGYDIESIDDTERRNWVWNHEPLYLRAKKEGVNFG